MRRNNKSFLNPTDLDATIHNIRGGGILASKSDLNLREAVFAAGCVMLMSAAKGDVAAVTKNVQDGVCDVNFRDYDRRTALHVAASEGKLEMVRYLIAAGAKVNRSDRWGGSPLDDALRHRHPEVAKYIRSKGGRTGNADKSTSLITAASEGDVEEVMMLVEDDINVNIGDYDKRTALHLAAGEGKVEVLKYLVENGADVNCEDRFGGRPLDDAMANVHKECADYLRQRGAKHGKNASAKDMGKLRGGLDESESGHELDVSKSMTIDSMKVEWTDLEMIDKIGAGEFGEIYKCRWRGSLVAAKCVKSAKIRATWSRPEETDELKQSMSQSSKDAALNDFRVETAILRQLRHPNICMLLGYSNTKDFEVMISELMKCSLLDVFSAHRVQGTRLKFKTQLRYAIELAKGMNYLHTCKPPILHRDLKPANLLIDFKDTLKISDFGLAKLRPQKGSKDDKETDKFIMTGETGSYRFMAPEVFRHEEYNETVDIYSFAMIFYNLLAGYAPWPSWNGVKAVTSAAMEGARPNIPREWDQQLATLLKKCWNENPKVRPRFMDVLEELNSYHQIIFKKTVDESTGDNVGGVQAGCECLIS